MQKITPITEDQWKLCNEFIDNSTEISPKSLKSYRSNLMI